MIGKGALERKPRWIPQSSVSLMPSQTPVVTGVSRVPSLTRATEWEELVLEHTFLGLGCRLGGVK